MPSLFNRYWFPILLVWLIPVSCVNAGWKIGTARVNITPEKFIWMSGYASRNKPAEGKLHDLWAKVIVLEDETGNRGLLITMDLIGIGRSLSVELCQAIQSRYKLPRNAISLSTSHTHTGPVVGRNLMSMYFFNEKQQQLVIDYTNRLHQHLLELVGKGIEDLEPCELKYGVGIATFAVNRRNNREADVPMLREKGELRGPVDHDVPVLVAFNAKKKMKVIVVGYACHATTLSYYNWSGDWPGFAQLHLEKQHPGTNVMFWAGCGADQNPLPRRKVELADQYGMQLATAVNQVLNKPLKNLNASLTMEYAEIPLAFGSLPTRDQLKKDKESTNRYIAARAKLLEEQWARQGKLSPTYPYPIQTWKLGSNHYWVFLGGEVVVDFSLRIKQEFGKSIPWVAGYCHDVMAYIPSLRVLKEGGYEGGGAMIYYGLPSPWSKTVEEDILKEVHRQRKRLSPKTPALRK